MQQGMQDDPKQLGASDLLMEKGVGSRIGSEPAFVRPRRGVHLCSCAPGVMFRMRKLADRRLVRSPTQPEAETPPLPFLFTVRSAATSGAPAFSRSARRAPTRPPAGTPSTSPSDSWRPGRRPPRVATRDSRRFPAVAPREPDPDPAPPANTKQIITRWQYLFWPRPASAARARRPRGQPAAPCTAASIFRPIEKFKTMTSPSTVRPCD